MNEDHERTGSEDDLKVIVLRRVIAIDSIGRRPGIPELIQELMDDIDADIPESMLERAVSDLAGEGLLCCENGVVVPTPDGFQAMGEAATSPTHASSPVAETQPDRSNVRCS